MAFTKENVLEPHLRYAGSALLYIDTSAAWSIGRNVNALVKVQFGDIKSIDDSTFGFSALAVEVDPAGGYKLYVRSDTSDTTIVEVKVSATGQVDAASIAALTRDQVFAVENLYSVDLDDSGGYGGEPLLIEGGSTNLYYSADQAYQLGPDAAHLLTMKVGGAPLTDAVLASVGFKIVEVVPTTGGYDVYAQDPSGIIFAAQFNAGGDYLGGVVLSTDQVNQVEQTLGTDIDGNSNVPAPSGWVAALKTATIRTAVNTALTNDGKIGYAEAVSLMQGIVQSHKASASPITADELADLQSVASRGRNLFTGANDTAVDYLSYVFSKMVESSGANKFYTGGQAKAAELGSLAAGSTAATLERLVSKWLLGGDMPSTATAGDAATGAAKAVSAFYAKSTGALFVDGVVTADVQQGTTGNCYMVAAVGGIAGTNVGAIQAMIVENATVDGVRSWGVRFFDAKGKAHWVTVNDMLPVDAEGSTTLAYGGAPGKSLNGEIWFALVEKAYAQINAVGILPRDELTGQNSYLAVEGGQGDPLAQVIAGKVVAYSLTPGTSFGGNPFIAVNIVDKNNAAAVNTLVETLKAAVNAGKTVWIGVNDSVKDAFGNSLLVGGHAHFVLDPDPANPNNSNMLVYNPWGISPLPSPPGPVEGEQKFVSPATYDFVQLVGISGLDFMILEAIGS